MSEENSQTEMIVMFQNRATEEEIAALIRSIDGEILDSIVRWQYPSYLVRVQSSKVQNCLSKLREQPLVYAAQLNHEHRPI